MIPQDANRMQQPGVVPLPPELVRQTNIFQTEHLEIVRENKEMKEQLEAALRENEQLKKGNRRGKSAGKGDDGPLRQLDAECLKLRKEKQVLVSEQGKLKADVKRSKKRLATEQSWSKQLSTQNCRLEVNLQADKGKIYTLTRQLGLRENQLKTKDSEIQSLHSKLKIRANSQNVYQNQSLRSRRDIKRSVAHEEMEMERECSLMGFDTKSERKVPDAGYPGLHKERAGGADNLTHHGSATQYKGEQQTRSGYGPSKADRVFWSTADEYSGAEVVSQVEKLNSEMLQVAASIADELDLENQMKGGQESDDITEAIVKTEKIIGPRLTNMLATSNSQCVDIMLQIALQTALLMHIQRIISSWSLWDGREDHALSKIHKRMQESESQTISGRWRQLTKRSIRRISERDLLPLLTESLANIIIATGYNLSRATVKERFMRFSPHLGAIIKLALEVNTMIGEGIASCDFEITFVPHDSAYDPKFMETVYSGNSPIHGKESVICTVDLGLMKVERVSKPEVHTKELVLLKPKVLLPAVFR